MIKPHSIHPPIHPGRAIRLISLPALGKSEKEIALALGVPVGAFSEIINERAPITPDLADGFAEIFGGTPTIWIQLQNMFDEHKASKVQKKTHHA